MMKFPSVISLLLIFCTTLLYPLFGQNYALQFDGLDDYVQGNTSGFPIRNYDRTIELWFYKISQPVEEGTLFGYGSWGDYGTAYEIFTIVEHAGETRLAFSQWGDGFVGTQLIRPGQWYHAAVVNTADKVKLFLNGQYESETDLYFDTSFNSSFYMGKAPAGYDDIRRFNGIIDEVRIWNRALTQQEIQANMYIQLSGSEEGLVGYWPLNEGDGNLANDLSGNNNYGAIFGATWVTSQSPVGGYYLHINPQYGYPGNIYNTSITGVNTHFSDNGGTSNVWISKNDIKIYANTFQADSNTALKAEFFIPADVPTGFWDINVQTTTDSQMIVKNALQIVEKGNYALQFDGLNGRIEIPDNTSLRIEQRITMECWINFEAGGSYQPRIFSKGPDGDGYEFLLTNDGEESELEVRIAPGQLISNNTLAAGKWYHVAATYDGSRIRIYINGVQDAIIQASGNLNISPLNLFIGQKSTDAYDQYKGLIDELRIWNIARSQEDIQTHMYSHLTGSEAGLVGYWSANEGAGNIVRDLSSKNNDGTIYGARWIVSRAPVGKVIVFCNPQHAYQSHNLSLSIQSANTHFLDGIENIWLSREDKTIFADAHTINSNTLLNAKLFIPQDASTGLWNINVESDIDSLITMIVAIEVLPPPSVKLQNSNTTSWLQSLYAIDDKTCWAAGNNGTIQKTEDGGNNWQSQNSSTTDVLYSVFFTDQMTGWVAGQYGTILKTTNGGEVWNRQDSRTSNNLQSVYFVNSQTGWMVGRLGTIIKTGDGGQTWQPQNSATTAWLYAVYFTDESNGWIVGNNGTILNTSDGGNSWITQTSGTTNYLSSVYFSDSNRGWITGSEGTLLNTSDGGKNWIIKNSNTSEWLKSVTFSDTQTGWIVGTNGTLIKIAAHDDSSWSTHKTFTDKTLNAVNFGDANTGWIVGEAGIVLNLTMIEQPTAIENDPGISYGPRIFMLHQNYPNPFNPFTMIKYNLFQPAHVSLKIYSILGQVIKEIVDEQQSAGIKYVQWDGTDRVGRKVSSGVYFYRLQAANDAMIKKMILLR